MVMKKILNYIDGSYCEPFTQDWLDNYNPSKGAVYSKIASSSSIDVDKAYQAAKIAFPSWSNTTIDERSAILLKIANLIEDNLDMLAEAESLDNGKLLISQEHPVILGFSHMPSHNLLVKHMKVLD